MFRKGSQFPRFYFEKNSKMSEETDNINKE